MSTKRFWKGFLLLVMGLTMGATVAFADVVYNDFNETPLTYTIGTTRITEERIIDLDLPGDASIAGNRFFDYLNNYFNLFSSGGTVSFQQVNEGSLKYVNGLAFGQTWSDGSPSSIGGWGNISALFTDSDGATVRLRADPTYIPFQFVDTTDSNTLKYGYIKTSTELTGSGVSSVVTLTIYGYAYETDGSQIVMGSAEDSDHDQVADWMEIVLADLGFVNGTVDSNRLALIQAYAHGLGVFTTNDITVAEAQGEANVTNAPASFNLYTSMEIAAAEAQGEANVTNAPNTFGLYTQDAVLDLEVGDIGVLITNGMVGVSLEMWQSDDLITWTNIGEAVNWTEPVESDKKFFRIRAKP